MGDSLYVAKFNETPPKQKEINTKKREVGSLLNRSQKLKNLKQKNSKQL